MRLALSADGRDPTCRLRSGKDLATGLTGHES